MKTALPRPCCQQKKEEEEARVERKAGDGVTESSWSEFIWYVSVALRIAQFETQNKEQRMLGVAEFTMLDLPAPTLP